MKRLKEFIHKVKRIIINWSNEFERRGEEKILKEKMKNFIDSM